MTFFLKHGKLHGIGKRASLKRKQFVDNFETNAEQYALLRDLSKYPYILAAHSCQPLVMHCQGEKCLHLTLLHEYKFGKNRGPRQKFYPLAMVAARESWEGVTGGSYGRESWEGVAGGSCGRES